MGNCVFKGSDAAAAARKSSSAAAGLVKVVTPGGGVMELRPPVSAETLTMEFPGHAVFPNDVSPPLLHHEHLCPGQSYYLLPLHSRNPPPAGGGAATPPPYRVSVDGRVQGGASTPSSRRQSPVSERKLKRHDSGVGTWKVRLAINSDQLSEILSQEARTEALIENVRSVAKCAARSKGVVPYDQRSWTSAPDTNSAAAGRDLE
ncbi:Unknown protein [Striga hermonthica]|uniref:Uncharacterized protein n=1 Tax=Striga hermonthica TaxID=68872 RepID=A0A9N7RHX4_STRHE|nr:Unknown protein [Striga hermonthica]